MISRTQHLPKPPGNARRLPVLVILGVLLAGLYGGLAVLSFQFSHEPSTVERPILAAIALLGGAFAVYAASIFVAVRIKDGAALLSVIVLAGVAFRVVSLYSWPILEIDIYRYLWDGAVVSEGVSPYRYSPKQVLAATPQSDLPVELRRLVELRDATPPVHTILGRVHYGELPTIYPPVSQAVFAAAVSATPDGAGVLERIVAMKAVLVIFDLATLAVVIAMLRTVGMHAGWSVVYGWCPLVVKEITNTGHLDSLAVFLTVAALWFAVRPLAIGAWGATGRGLALASAVLLALAVGAKLYPVVLAPVFAALWVRVLGWRWAAVVGLIFVATTSAILWPMVPPLDHLPTPDARAAAESPAIPPPLPPFERAAFEPQNPAGGLTAFLRRWEMNDFLFLLTVENIRSPHGVPVEQRPWFSVVPVSWKERFTAIAARWFRVAPSEAAFFTARLLTGGAFIGILAGLVWRARHSADAADWLRVAFLVLAWFWLLSPTQNPWYWLWALPLAVFARGRAWLAVSGLVMVYYLRFWLVEHWADAPVLGTRYAGAAFFDFVVVWFEYGPWFVWLAWEAARRRTEDKSDPTVK